MTQAEQQNSVSSLTGAQRKILLSIYKNCKLFGGATSQEMTIEHLATISKCNKKSVKTTISRLKKNGSIEVSAQKNGRGGWVKYKINNSLFSDILRQENQLFNPSESYEIIYRNTNGTQTEHKWNTNGTQTEHKRNTEPNTEPNTTAPSSSSNIINTTTTELTEDWLKIDLTPLEGIKLTKGYLKQIAGFSGVTPESAQESINYFSFDIEHNNKLNEIKKDPISFFIGILRKKGMYLPPTNYESPQEIAMKSLLEFKKAAKEKMDRLVDSYVDIEYPAWRSSLTPEQMKVLLPGITMLSNKSPGATEHFLKAHYKEKVLIPSLIEKGILTNA